MQPQKLEPVTPQTPNMTPAPSLPPTPPETPVPDPAPSPNSELPQVPKKRMSKNAKIAIIAVISFVLLLALGIATLFAFVLNSTKSMESASNKFFDSIQANDPGSAYALTSEGFKDATPEPDFNEFVEALSPALQGEEKITDRKIISNNGKTNGVVVYSLETDDGTVYVRAVLEKSDDWKVHNFRSDKSPLETVLE